MGVLLEKSEILKHSAVDAAGIIVLVIAVGDFVTSKLLCKGAGVCLGGKIIFCKNYTDIRVPNPITASNIFKGCFGVAAGCSSK